MSTITGIREAVLSDVDIIANIHAGCWREVYKFMPETVLSVRDKNFRKKQWICWFKEQPKAEALFVLESGHEVVGFAVAKPNRDTAIDALGEFHACYILPEYRGGQAGPLAMMALAVFLKEQRLWPACIWAFKENPYRRIYPALGCQPLVFRDRQIAGVGLPEIGYKVADYGTLMARLDRMRVSAAQRETAPLRQQRLLSRLHG